MDSIDTRKETNRFLKCHVSDFYNDHEMSYLAQLTGDYYSI